MEERRKYGQGANIHIHPCNHEVKLDAILQLLRETKLEGIEMAQEIDDILAAAKANRDAEDSALKVINGILQRIADAVAAAGSLSPADKANLTQETANLKASAAALAAAIVAQTPAATPPPA